MSNRRDMFILGVIPARGGSKGLPRKNILLVNGRPLIDYTIKQALASRLLSDFLVSTEDPEIAQVAKACGAPVPFLRPVELAQDDTHTPEFIEHAVVFIERQRPQQPIDAVLTLQPTSPIRTSQDIDKAITLFAQLKCDSLFSSSPAKTSPWSTWMLADHDRRYLNPVIAYPTGKNPANLERQERIATYEDNGAIYITDRKYLKRTGNIINPHSSAHYMMPPETYIDIDTEYDLILLQQVIDRFNLP